MEIVSEEKKNKARREAQKAVRVGLLKRLPCEICGAVKTDGHHPNYDKPLEIRWLCKKHHLRLHAHIRWMQRMGFSSPIEINNGKTLIYPPKSYKALTSRQRRARLGFIRHSRGANMNQLLTIAQLAKELDVNIDTLRRWRKNGEGPSYILLGEKTIRYHREDVNAWITAHKVNPSCDEAGQD